MRHRPDAGISRAGLLGILALASMLGLLVYVLVSSRHETPGPVSIPDGAGQTPSSQPAGEGSPAAAIKPRTVPESEPAVEAASQSGALEIEVIGPKGAPASNARLVLTRGRDVLAAATTDAKGLAKLASGEGEAALLIVPERAPRYETAISIKPGRHRIELPGGVSISGRVEVDGAPPKDVVRLWADPQGVERSAAVWQALNADSTSGLTTAASGTFEIDGLKPGSDWKFEPRSVGYRLEEIAVDGRTVFAVTAPSKDVVMKLSRLPVVRGRVVSGPEHAPVPKGILMISFQGPTSGTMRSKWLRADGRFEFPVGDESTRAMTIKSITIEITDRTRAGKKTVVLDPAPDRDLDLGDVEMPAASKLRFEVRDPSGTPIAGALARIGEADVDPGTRTDAQGIGTVLVPPDAKTVWVGGLKHEVQEVPVPDPLPELLRVVLRPAAGLEIVILSKEGTPASSVRARIGCKAPSVWSTESGFGKTIQVAAGATQASFVRGWGLAAEADFPPAADGRVIVSGLHSGIPLTVAVLNELDEELASASVTLEIGEWKTIELRLTEAPRVLKGRVRDAAGAPIGEARVIVGKGENVGSRCRGSNVPPRIATTDANGRFVLDGLYDGTKNLAVDKRGYVTLVRKDFTWPADDTELEFTLETGFTLTVKVVEADGKPIRDLSVSVTTPGLPDWCQENKGPGVYVFTDFPKGAVATIATQWATKTWTRTVPVRSDLTETITMPAAGKVEIDYGAIEGEAFVVELRGRDIPADRGPNWRFEGAKAGSPRMFLAEPVLPGDYEAALLELRPGEQGTLAAPLVPVTVRAGEMTSVVFRKQ